jgi:hypothetical protein
MAAERLTAVEVLMVVAVLMVVVGREAITAEGSAAPANDFRPQCARTRREASCWLRVQVMRWIGDRESENIEDRRGASGGFPVGIGGIGAIVVVLVGLFLGVDPSTLLALSAFELYHGAASLGEDPCGGAKGVGGRGLIAAERQIDDDECL